jgi:membrane protein
MTTLRTLFDMLKQTFQEWNEHNAPRLAAALAYYVTFSLAPLLVITIAVVGFVLQESFVREEVLDLVTSAVGPSAGVFVGDLMDGLRKPDTGVVSTILGLGALLLGALGAFEQLKDALNTVWNVPASAKSQGIRGFFTNKLLSFGMVLVIGFLLLVSLILSTVLTAFEAYTMSLWGGAEFALRLANLALSFGIVMLLFAMIYRFLPDIRLEWRDVWVGAFITSVLFTIGKFALGLYLGRSGIADAYGAAGSLVLILLWIFYSAQIVLFGAEFTQVYARRYGSLRDKPNPDNTSTAATANSLPASQPPSQPNASSNLS